MTFIVRWNHGASQVKQQLFENALAVARRLHEHDPKSCPEILTDDDDWDQNANGKYKHHSALTREQKDAIEEAGL